MINDDFLIELIDNFREWYKSQDYSEYMACFSFIEDCFEKCEAVSKATAREMADLKKEIKSL